MGANFLPTFDYNKPGTFRFWCQKVLPLVYDDSLSYYELLCKVSDYINKIISDNSDMVSNIEALNQAYLQLQDYVNNYFNSTDFNQKIDDKIDEMAADGELLAILAPVTTELTNYLREEVRQQQIYNAHTRDLVSTMVGHPFTAASAADMDDTEKIYIYVGETTGSLTYGDWYYYNGTAWVSGGEYIGSTSFTDLERIAAEVVSESAIGNDIIMEAGTFSDSDAKTHVVNTARQRCMAALNIENIAGIIIPSGYEMFVYCLDETMTKIGAASNSWYEGYFNIFNCLVGTKYINIAVRNIQDPTDDISEDVIIPTYLYRQAPGVTPLYNVADGGIIIDGYNVVVNTNGFAFNLNGKLYYIAPVDNTTVSTFTPSNLTANYFLVVETTGLTAGSRTNPLDCMKIISTLDRDSASERYVVIAAYNYRRWKFVSPFDIYYKKPVSVDPDYVGWNVAANGIRIVGNNVVVNENGFCLGYDGKMYYIAPTDLSTVTTFTPTDATQFLVIDPAQLTNVNGRNNPADCMEIINFYGTPGYYNKDYIYVAAFYKTYWDFCGKFLYFDKPTLNNTGKINGLFLEKHMIAHQGGNAGESNTIANFQLAVEHGYKVVECDVHFTSDSVAVLSHNDYIEVNSQQYTIADYSYATLKALKNNLATLEELLVFAKDNNLCIDIDFTKEYSTAQTEILYNLLAQHAAFSRCMVTTFAAPARQLIGYTRDVIICISNITASAIGPLVDVFQKATLTFGSIESTNVTEELIDAVHKAGGLTKIWTVNSTATIETYTGYGADMFITDSVRDPGTVPPLPTADGEYVLKATVSGSVVNYSWVSA